MSSSSIQIRTRAKKKGLQINQFNAIGSKSLTLGNAYGVFQYFLPGLIPLQI